MEQRKKKGLLSFLHTKIAEAVMLSMEQEKLIDSIPVR